MFHHRTQGHDHLPRPERAVLARQRARRLAVWTVLAGLQCAAAPLWLVGVAPAGILAFTLAAAGVCAINAWTWSNASEDARVLDAERQDQVPPTGTPRQRRGLVVADEEEGC